MHDITSLDSRGIAGCVVATEEFQQAAKMQSAALGLVPEIVWVPHPIQNLSPTELEQLVDDALERIIAACTPA
ncbi:MAG: hypothetical protein CMQ61_10435 [Gammaproteobacteria bacterium]|nr:hypothetical protein [Gammaproteobacteria bacterium]